jgi:hypothetical protein
MFPRVLYPMVVWIRRQTRFFPNWEVDRIVHIPLRNLLKPEFYACYRLRFKTSRESLSTGLTQDFPCFCHESEGGKEVLWGVTYRIVTAFLELVFEFSPPDITALPVIHGALDENYLNGAAYRGG